MEINGKQILTALNHCLDNGTCWHECPYRCEGKDCYRALYRDVIKLIERQNNKIIDLGFSLQQAQTALDLEKSKRVEKERSLFERREVDELIASAKVEAAQEFGARIINYIDELLGAHEVAALPFTSFVLEGIKRKVDEELAKI